MNNAKKIRLNTDVLSSFNSDNNSPTTKTRLFSAIDDYLLDKEIGGISSTTINSYKNALDQIYSFVSQELKEKPLVDWTQKDIDEIFLAIKNGKKRNKDSPLSEKTKETYLRNLRQFIKWCVTKQYIASFLVVKPFVAPQAPPKMYSEEEINLLCKQPKNVDRMTFHELRNYTMTMLLIETGIRRTSLINIKIKDLDLNNNSIQIVKSKNKNVYSVSLTNAMVKLLDIYLKVRIPVKNGNFENEVLFCDEYQNQLTTNGINSIMKKYIKSRGITYRGIHAFRHATASLMYKNGASISEIAQQTGHKDLRQVEGYVHSIASLPQEKINKFSPLANMGFKEVV